MKEFKNEIAKEIAEVLSKNAVHFDGRKAGGTFRSILMSLSWVFKEDYEAIQQYIGEKQLREIPTGGATLLRKADDDRSKSSDFAPCEGCPDVVAGGYAYQAAQIVEPSNKKIVKTVNAKDKPFESEDDIMERFEGKGIAMQAFAQKNKISIPTNMTKASTIAKYIFEHYQNPSENEDTV
mgnify:CR=1 FL=1